MTRRRLFNFAAASCTLLAAASLLLWAASFAVNFSWSKARMVPAANGTTYQFYTSIGLVEGHLNFAKTRRKTTVHVQWPWTWRVRPDDNGYGIPTTLGFFYEYGAGTSATHGNYSSLMVVVPVLLIPAILAILPVYWLYRWRNRVRPNSCRDCGYDLTGNTSGVCPECGTGTAQQSAVLA